MQLCMIWIAGLRLLVTIIYLFDPVLQDRRHEGLKDGDRKKGSRLNL